MRGLNWRLIILVGVTVILFGVATACKSKEQVADEKARERLPSLVGITVSPIQAIFDQKTFSTTYRVEVGGESEHSFFRARWSGPDCGNWSATKNDEEVVPMFSSTYEFKWYHPHPPCPETTDHTHVDVRLVLTQVTYDLVGGNATNFKDTGVKVVCTYHGSETGTGPAAVWQ